MVLNRFVYYDIRNLDDDDQIKQIAFECFLDGPYSCEDFLANWITKKLGEDKPKPLTSVTIEGIDYYPDVVAKRNRDKQIAEWERDVKKLNFNEFICKMMSEGYHQIKVNEIVLPEMNFN